MPISLLLNWRLWIALALAALLAVTHWRAYELGQEDVRLDWEVEKRERAQAREQAEREARERETAMRDSLDKIKKEKSDAEKKLVADYTAVIASLLQRPDRPSEAAPDPGNPVGCTGAELYRSDGEFLAGEAARADGLRIRLEACQRAYDEVRLQYNAQ